MRQTVLRPHGELSVFVGKRGHTKGRKTGLLFAKVYLFYMYGCFVCMHVCAPYMYLMLRENKGGCQLLWDQSYTCLWAAMMWYSQKQIPGHLIEHSVLLSTEPAVQAPIFLFWRQFFPRISYGSSKRSICFPKTTSPKALRVPHCTLRICDYSLPTP